MNWYLEGLKKYAVFSGRSRRKEYWYFFLFNLIIHFILIIIDTLTGTYNLETGMGLLSTMYFFAVLLPSIAVSVRRLHDTNRRGWWILLSLIPIIGAIVLFIFMVQDSTPGENRFGNNPKEAVSET
ncbi:MAG: DUF805 domain-containing protein [Flexistipes sinusarabici]|uniref:DUF805 domain-containing protein n=1 Tax=Flexistipes sinusarabici TaxID=2352 RepID=A0A5D0MN98_FLESI|nr:DUF805 domain-containing protein [Flexistipes sinusarabici]TYB32728.1 MAG: DUF805 domain-containing protein [Flexistipes sinusarabici]